MNNSILNKASSAFIGWNSNRKTIKELSAMPNYMLLDIGVDRGEIRSVVYGSPSNASADALNSGRSKAV